MAETRELGVEVLDTGVDEIRFVITSWLDDDGVNMQLTTDRGGGAERVLYEHIVPGTAPEGAA